MPSRRTTFILTTLIIVGAVVVYALRAPHVDLAPAGLVGVWRSPEFDGVWFTETFRDDGTVRTDYFATVNGKARAFPDKTTVNRWRVVDDVIQLGHTDDAGKFVQDGNDLAIGFKNGSVDSIGGLERVPTTQPAK